MILSIRARQTPGCRDPLPADQTPRWTRLRQPSHYTPELSRRARGIEIGRRLAPLRDEGVLIVGSGNLVHNLHAYAWGRHTPDPYDWAVRFETEAKEMMLAGEYKPLIEYEKLGTAALLSIPTPEHYLPLLYVAATRQPGELITFPVEGVDGGSISMLAVQVGNKTGTTSAVRNFPK
jgi:aromatic ring-opening dioxygenase catalytic subunit (LigB family)